MSVVAGDVVDDLLARNAVFASTEFRRIDTIGPLLRTIIVGCVDSRIDPARVLGISNGDAVVIRNVGGRVTPELITTLATLRLVASADNEPRPGAGWNLIVMQHTDCGITRLAGRLDVLAQYFGVSIGRLSEIPIDDPFAAVRFDVEALRSNPLLPTEVLATGLVYDVETGTITRVEPRSDAGS